MTKLKLGVIGLGRFSTLHFQSLKQIEGVTVTAVADTDPLRAQRVAGEWGCTAYTDWRQMLSEQSLDAVSVLTPESYHAEPVISALQAGSHVFVEKPLAVDSASGQKMLRAAEAAGKQLMVGHVCRFDARYIAIERAIREGRLGTLRSIYARRNNPKKYFSTYRRTNPIFILGIHDIDLLHWFTGSPVSEVYAYSTGSGPDRDLVWSMLKFANGTIGVIENNWLLPDHSPAEQDVRMEVVGESGTVHVQDPDQTLAFWSDDTVTTPASYSWNEVYGRYSGALYEELHHFFSCIRNQQPSNILRPAHAFAAVKVAEAIIRSSETGQPVAIDPYELQR